MLQVFFYFCVQKALNINFKPYGESGTQYLDCRISKACIVFSDSQSEVWYCLWKLEKELWLGLMWGHSLVYAVLESQIAHKRQHRQLGPPGLVFRPSDYFLSVLSLLQPSLLVSEASGPYSTVCPLGAEKIE